MNLKSETIYLIGFLHQRWIARLVQEQRIIREKFKAHLVWDKTINGWVCQDINLKAFEEETDALTK